MMKKSLYSPLFATAIVLVTGALSFLWMMPSDAGAMILSDQAVVEPKNAPSHDGDDAEHEAMHNACISGDTDAMQRHMDNAHPGGDMGSGMGNGHMRGGGMTGGGMMGSGMTGGAMMRSGTGL